MTLKFEWSSTGKVCLYYKQRAVVTQLIERKLMLDRGWEHSWLFTSVGKKRKSRVRSCHSIESRTVSFLACLVHQRTLK